jgi:hypothetical protein
VDKHLSEPPPPPQQQLLLLRPLGLGVLDALVKMHRIYTTLRGEIGAYIKHGRNGPSGQATCVGLQGIDRVQLKRKTIRKIRRAYLQEEYDLDTLLHEAEGERQKLAWEKEQAEQAELPENVGRREEQKRQAEQNSKTADNERLGLRTQLRSKEDIEQNMAQLNAQIPPELPPVAQRCAGSSVMLNSASTSGKMSCARKSV